LSTAPLATWPCRDDSQNSLHVNTTHRKEPGKQEAIRRQKHPLIGTKRVVPTHCDLSAKGNRKSTTRLRPADPFTNGHPPLGMILSRSFLYFLDQLLRMYH
jgi:hypothetical protein